LRRAIESPIGSKGHPCPVRSIDAMEGVTARTRRIVTITAEHAELAENSEVLVCVLRGFCGVRAI